ncbi:MAG: valine--tRNA ligase [Patescibacteria group bacterium]
MKKELAKTYEPQKYEDKIYEKWEKSGFFNPDVCVKKGICDEKSESFSIVLPPPNVTGTLHMGHAAMLAIQDVLIRFQRMSGKKTLWLPGTDHAAVATESKVEKMLIEKEGLKKPKQELGKEKFLEKVKEFAKNSHDTIIGQTKKMGASLDWSREAYTLDEIRHKAVYSVFKKMYDDGLIYRGFRVINWSVKGQSTCSDDELVYIERPAKIYTFKYNQDFPIAIATTRPETKLGDTAVAVNPQDKRYKKFIGKTFEIKNFADSEIDLKIKIIADEHVDMKYGTGAVGVTPAHSSVDFEMYLKQKSLGNEIGMIQIIDKDGKMSDKAGKYAGLEVLKCREEVLENLKKNNLFIKEEDTIQNVGTSDRFGDVIESLPMTQWFIDVNKKFKINNSKLKNVKNGDNFSLKELMQITVKSGQIKIIPEQFEKVYFNWIDNLKDWCISRQIWFGHQIPVWYKTNLKLKMKNSKDEEKDIYVGTEAPKGNNWIQDTDTLDTWFSSGLWTFSTLANSADQIKIENEKIIIDSEDFRNFHPTTVMETGYDILFFWVARMILMTTYTFGDIPFKTVYLHGLVRDEKGKKMSKSLGNTIDPLQMIEKYGADATRLSLLIGNTPGNDMKLSEEKIAGFRNFTNKLWNISRFMLLNIDEPKNDIVIPKTKTLADKWILNNLSNLLTENEKLINNFNLSLAGEKLRDFTWNELADWYLEIAKIEGDKSEILNYILNTILKLWHPFMPFVTEEIWQEIYGENKILLVEKMPKNKLEKIKKIFSLFTKKQDKIEDFSVLQNIIIKIRSVRSENKIEPVKKIDVIISAGNKKSLLENNKEVIKVLSRLEKLEIFEKMDKPEKYTACVESGVEIFLDFSSNLNKEKENIRLKLEIEKINPYIKNLQEKLNNKNFVDNAPEKVVEIEKNKLAEAQDKLNKLQKQLENLK